MIEKINTIDTQGDTTEQAATDPFEANPQIQEGLQESQAAAQRLFEQENPADTEPTSDPDSVRPSTGISNGAKFGIALGTTVSVLTGAAGGAVYGAANENAHNESKTVISSTTFTPNPEYGNLDSPAQAAVQEILEANGLNPNQFGYEDVRHELGNATDELKQETGDEVVQAGEPFTVDLITSTGVFGENRTSIDITPNRVLDSQESKTDTAPSEE